ncbi:MAG: hypothetical protein QG567_2135 [Campylobacterota bacterium]|nr:hypothetical protein [Campylobacterota bacterium]
MAKIREFSEAFKKAVTETDFSKFGGEEIDDFDIKHKKELYWALGMNANERSQMSKREWVEALLDLQYFFTHGEEKCQNPL